MTDDSNLSAGKTLFTERECSQAYHSVQMADDNTVQLLAFNLASSTYAYKFLAQGPSKSGHVLALSLGTTWTQSSCQPLYAIFLTN